MGGPDGLGSWGCGIARRPSLGRRMLERGEEQLAHLVHIAFDAGAVFLLGPLVLGALGVQALAFGPARGLGADALLAQLLLETAHQRLAGKRLARDRPGKREEAGDRRADGRRQPMLAEGACDLLDQGVRSVMARSEARSRRAGPRRSRPHPCRGSGSRRRPPEGTLGLSATLAASWSTPPRRRNPARLPGPAVPACAMALTCTPAMLAPGGARGAGQGDIPGAARRSRWSPGGDIAVGKTGDRAGPLGVAMAPGI